MNVEFNNENDFQKEFNESKPVTGMTKWLINKGIAKNKKTAQGIMVLVIIICLSIAIYFAIK